MSQPYQRSACIPAPGKVDPTLGEFWVENPWDIVTKGHNLSCFERNRVYLNVKDGSGRGFVEISHLTGADSEGDGRSVVAADFRNTGMLDLVVRQAGGGALLLFENQFPQKHYLKVSLRGQCKPGQSPTSNPLGIGARLVAEVQGQTLVRDMYPVNSFRSQAPAVVHFGLGDATKVDRLLIRWPSGREQALTNLAADRHILVDEAKEGDRAVELMTSGKTLTP